MRLFKEFFLNEATPTIQKVSIKGPNSYDLKKLQRLAKSMNVRYEDKILDDGFFYEIEFQNTKDMQKFDKLKQKAK